MPRRTRVDYRGAWHHVMNRGAAKAQVFFEDEDCVEFLNLLEDSVVELGLEVHAYSLMKNHFHLLVRSAEANVSVCMQRVGGRFTQRRNRRQGVDGPVFRGRFRSQLVTDERYLRHLVAYIHLNPVRAGLVRRADEECWTSHRAHVGLEAPPSWLSRDMISEQFGSPEQVQAFVADLQRKRQPWPAELDLETGWLHRSRRVSPAEAEATGRVHSADTVLRSVRAITGASAEALRTVRPGRGSNPARRFAVGKLRQHTALTHAEIAAVIGGSAGSIAQLVHRARRGGSSDLGEWEAQWDTDALGSEASEQ